MSRRRDIVPIQSWADPAPAYAALALLVAPALAVGAACLVAGLWLLPARALVWLALPTALLVLCILFPPGRRARR